jgi:hypothetical protein
MKYFCNTSETSIFKRCLAIKVTSKGFLYENLWERLRKSERYTEGKRFIEVSYMELARTKER